MDDLVDATVPVDVAQPHPVFRVSDVTADDCTHVVAPDGDDEGRHHRLGVAGLQTVQHAQYDGGG